MTVLDAGHRERRALLGWWKRNAVGLRSFMSQMEKTIYDLGQDLFILPEGESIKVVDCIKFDV